MILSIVLICIAAFTLLSIYRRDHISAVCFGLFILLMAPETIEVRIHESLPSISIHRVIVALMLLKSFRDNRGPRGLAEVPFLRLFLFLGLSYFVSTLFSEYLLVSTKRYLYYLMEGICFFWIMFNSVQSRRDAERMLKTAGVAFAVVSIFAIVERYTGFKIHSLFPRGIDETRFSWAGGLSEDVTATYAHRILLGVACVLGALGQMIELAVGGTWREYRVPLFRVALCLAALYFSMSRGPWLGLILGAGILFAIWRAKMARWGAALAAAILAVLLVRPGVWMTISGLAFSTLDVGTVKGSSYEWRWVVVRTAVGEMRRAGIAQKLFGFGGGSQIMNDFEAAEAAPGLWLPVESWDCEYAIVLYERGVIGIALYIVLELSALLQLIRLLRMDVKGVNRPVLSHCMVGLCVLFFAKTNVAIFAPQLVFAEGCFFGITSRYISARIRPQDDAAFFG